MDRNDYSRFAYWHQSEGHSPHADLAPVADRLARRWPGHGFWDE